MRELSRSLWSMELSLISKGWGFYGSFLASWLKKSVELGLSSGSKSIGTAFDLGLLPVFCLETGALSLMAFSFLA